MSVTFFSSEEADDCGVCCKDQNCGVRLKSTEFTGQSLLSEKVYEAGRYAYDPGEAVSSPQERGTAFINKESEILIQLPNLPSFTRANIFPFDQDNL